MPDTGAAPEPLSAKFESAAAQALVPVAAGLDSVAGRVGTGELRLDTEVAERLLDDLAALATEVDELLVRAGEEIDQPLSFGHNIVADVMSRRFANAAAGGDDAAIPVLCHFREQIRKVRHIVESAAERTVATDEDAAHTLSATLREREGERA